MSKASFKTYAHALVLARSSRRLTTGKPGYHIDAIVRDGRKSFVLSCGSEVSTAEIPEGGSVRDIADQLVSILASKSGATAQDMAMGDVGAGERTKLVLQPLNVAAKRSK